MSKVKDREGTFWWEANVRRVGLQSLGGVDDWAGTIDRRSHGYEGLPVHPAVAISCSENWGDECLNPYGLPDGDLPYRDTPFCPLEELGAVDIYGNPIEDLLTYFPGDERWPGNEFELDGYVEIFELPSARPKIPCFKGHSRFGVEASVNEKPENPRFMGKERSVRRKLRKIERCGNSRGWRGSDRYKTMRRGGTPQQRKQRRQLLAFAGQSC